MAAALAAAPILALLALIVGLRWSAAAAGLAAASLTAAIALTAFDFGTAGALRAMVGSAMEAAFSAATILWIVFAALAIHEYQTRSGAIATFRAWLNGAVKPNAPSFSKLVSRALRPLVALLCRPSDPLTFSWARRRYQ